MLDSKPEADTGSRQIAHSAGRIEYRNVTHIYASGSDPAVHNLNLIIESGERVALVGRSGSGKTTIASLLPRFYDVTEGKILVDNIPIQELTLASLRQQISLVSQEVSLFNDSVARNIAYGMETMPPLFAIEAAAEKAYALDFIRALPQGFDTLIGDQGMMLSGGQRQRLAIARAVLKDAPILILDEATSALDNESERYIQRALNEMMRGRTTLIIAHRLSTIENADRILVMDQGRIVEMGTHQNLLAAGGVYATLQGGQAEASPAVTR